MGRAPREEEGGVSVAAGETAALSLADLDYDLPPELVAQAPLERRDDSRLLVVRRAGGPLEDRTFRELPGLLRAGDVLVRNDTRVFPARAHFRRATGGRIEVLFLRPLPWGAGEGTPAAAGEAPGERWEALLRGRPRPGETLLGEAPGRSWALDCVRALGDGRWVVESPPGDTVIERLESAGETPLPPYIHAPLADPERYQTTYARVVGSAAAPTAGLHFTAALDDALEAAGVAVETVTLHVGLGTFKPLQAETLTAGRLHGEAYEVKAAVWARLRAARAEGRRVIAVGTTSLRVLEHLAQTRTEADAGAVLRGETELFIAPGYEFRAVDALVTNFHLPRTSLLALVMAFCGRERTLRAYEHAVAGRYRFYSLGDAMVAL